MITLISILIIAGVILFALRVVSNRDIKLTGTEKIHLAVLFIINFIIICKLISIAWEGNDKGVLLVLFGYPALTAVNGLAWLILKVLKRPESNIYRLATVALAVLFIPALLISGL